MVIKKKILLIGLLALSICLPYKVKSAGLTNDTNSKSLQIGSLSIDELLVLSTKTKNQDSAVLLLNRAKKLAIDKKDNRKLGLVYLALARLKLGAKQQEDGKQLINEALSIFKKHNYRYESGEAYLLQAAFFNSTIPNEIAIGVTVAKKAVNCFDQIGNKQKLADAYSQLAELLNKQGHLSQAMVSIQKAININKDINIKQLYDCFLIKGQILFKLGAFEQALSCFQSLLSPKGRAVSEAWKSWSLYNHAAVTCIGLGSHSMAEVFFNQALAISESEKQLNAVMLIRINIMAFYVLEKDGKKALEFIKETEDKYPLKRMSDLLMVNARKVDTYLLLKDTLNAKMLAKELAELSAYVNKKERAEAYTALIPFYLLTKQNELAEKYLIYNDYFYQTSGYSFDVAQNQLLWSKLDSAKSNLNGQANHRRKYLNTRDSLLRITQGREIAALGSTFNTTSVAGPPYEADIFPAIPTIESANQAKWTTILLYIGIGFLLLLIIVGSIRLYNVKKRAKRELQKKQDEIVEKNNSLQHMVNQKDILLEEKEWLMKEIHHRVKNNLQIVISLLNTQSAYLDDNKASSAIRESQQRMQSISLIHQKLYQSNNMDMVDMKDYMTELIENLVSSFGLGKHVLIEKDIEKIQLDVSRAVPIGLIINEAIINSIKYAFPDKREGTIKISFQTIESQGYILKIADDGNGLPEGFDIDKCKSLGMNLIKGLAKQVKGKVFIESNKGVSVIINFGAEKESE